MELAHDKGKVTLHYKSCSIHVDNHFTTVTFSLEAYSGGHLCNCRVDIPMSAEFFLQSCTMKVDGKDRVAKRRVAREMFKHEMHHRFTMAKLHSTYNTLLSWR